MISDAFISAAQTVETKHTSKYNIKIWLNMGKKYQIYSELNFILNIKIETWVKHLDVFIHRCENISTNFPLNLALVALADRQHNVVGVSEVSNLI